MLFVLSVPLIHPWPGFHITSDTVQRYLCINSITTTLNCYIHHIHNLSMSTSWSAFWTQTYLRQHKQLLQGEINSRWEKALHLLLPFAILRTLWHCTWTTEESHQKKQNKENSIFLVCSQSQPQSSASAHLFHWCSSHLCWSSRHDYQWYALLLRHVIAIRK